MERTRLPKWPRFPEGQKVEVRKKILMFSVFLLISVFIWLLNALSKNYNSVIEYPLVYTDVPEDRVFVGELPEHLDLSINAHGYALLRYKIFKKPVPISFKVSSFPQNRQENNRAYILTRYLNEQVRMQLPSELQLLGIKPDTLHFQFARRKSRVLPVRADVSFQADKQFTTVDGIRLDPEMVDVIGPDLVLDTLQAVYTEHTDLGLLTRDYHDKLKLRRIPDLEYGIDKVDCSIELERFTEENLSLSVEVLNLPDSLTVRIFPASIKLTCKVGLSKYERLGNHQFRAVVDYREQREGNAEFEVVLLNVPAYILDYEYYPRKVEILSRRK